MGIVGGRLVVVAEPTATRRIDSGKTGANNRDAAVGVRMTVRNRITTYRRKHHPATRQVSIWLLIFSLCTNDSA